LSGVGTGIAIAAGIGGVGALGGAALQSSAAGNAASTQANAADQAAQLQYQAEQNALGFQQQIWNQEQTDAAPWLQSGAGALTTLDSLMGLKAPNLPANYGVPNTSAPGAASPNGGIGKYVPIGSGNAGYPGYPGKIGYSPEMVGGKYGGGPIISPTPIGVKAPGTPGSPIPVKGVPQQPVGQPGVASGQLQPFAPWTEKFTAPTAATEQNDPGYQFRLSQGTKALQNSAAARGDLLSGNTLRDITQYGQDYASNEYQNVYNRALQGYQQNYNIYENNQANQWNRLAALSGIGQTAVNQLNSAGQNAASNYGNTSLTGAGLIGQNLNNAAAATASGYVGGANAWGGALGSLGSLGSMIPYLQMLNQQGAGSGAGQTLYEGIG